MAFVVYRFSWVRRGVELGLLKIRVFRICRLFTHVHVDEVVR